MRVGTTSALIGLNVLLAVLIAGLWITPQGQLRGTRWQPPAAVRPDLGTAPAVLAGQDDTDTARYVAILDRPLFTPGRRPAPVAARADAAGRPDPLDGLHLYGVFSGPDGGGIIARVEGKSRRVKVSETLGDWSLKEIRGHQVIFSRGAETRTVALAQARQGSVSSASAAAGRTAAASVPGGETFLRRPRPVPRMPMPPGYVAPPAAAAPATVPAAPAVAAPAKPATPPPAASKPGVTSNSSSPFVIGGSR